MEWIRTVHTAARVEQLSRFPLDEVPELEWTLLATVAERLDQIR